MIHGQKEGVSLELCQNCERYDPLNAATKVYGLRQPCKPLLAGSEDSPGGPIPCIFGSQFRPVSIVTYVKRSIKEECPHGTH